MEGFCYTQQYDVEQEKNGLLTYEREHKIDYIELKKMNEDVMEIVNGRGEITGATVTRLKPKRRKP